MFDPSPKPRLFACPPGADFPRALVDGLRARFDGHPPMDLARVRVYVNTRRMARRITELFDDGPAVLLPRIAPITDLTNQPVPGIPHVATPSLRRRLELRRLVAALVQANPGMAPSAAVADLADSLAGLIEELDGEGIDPAALSALRTDTHSDHWERTLAFLNIALKFTHGGGEAPGPAGRFRLVAEHLTRGWAATLPADPILIAGSTGSRGTTALLMRAVARLPQGAVIVPGFDFDLPGGVWQSMRDAKMPPEDHPQYRYARLMGDLGLTPTDIALWGDPITPRQQARNRILSLALRPAPVTSAWLTEAPKLAPDLAPATDNMALIEADTQRDEAMAIAFALREAAELGRTAALITTDHGLTRMVTAALDRWRIKPDASVGAPLMMTPIGVFMRLVLGRIGGALAVEDMLALLKHPFAASGGGRPVHLDLTRQLEVWMRYKGLPVLDVSTLGHFMDRDAEEVQTDAARAWAAWLSGLIPTLQSEGGATLGELVDHLVDKAEQLATGPAATGEHELWGHEAGREMRKFLAELQAETDFAGAMNAPEFIDLFETFAVGREARDPIQPHPDIMIWGTLEARVQGADLVILGGLNDGIWPAHPGADPWLNRDLRRQAGMLLPERNIGLAAHDFQQAIAANHVVLTRAKRDAEAETVPSRWLSRLDNLLLGMGDKGKATMEAMRDRGATYLRLSQELDQPTETVDPAPRPAPAPPEKARPKVLSITDITNLIRDPYAVYAKRVLGLYRLNPIRPVPDPRLRGNILHHLMEEFIEKGDLSAPETAVVADLLARMRVRFDAECAWDEMGILWQEKFAPVAGRLVSDELARQAGLVRSALEQTGEVQLDEVGMRLKGRADRIDVLPGGRAVIYDYKTGKPPGDKEVTHFEKQLLLEAVMLQAGGFDKLGPLTADKVAYIGLGSDSGESIPDYGPDMISQLRDELVTLLKAYQSPDKGFASRRAIKTTRFDGDYDHLARLGEWDETADPVRIALT